VEIKHPARLFLHRDPAVDLGHPGRKNRQLKLRHSSLLPQLQYPLQIHFPDHSVFTEWQKSLGRDQEI
jgi:hypothetical protein